MPLLKYFSCVGAVLLALMVGVGSYLPQQPEGVGPLRYDIRVRADRSGPTVAGPTTFADFSGTLQPSANASTSSFREAMAKAAPVDKPHPKRRIAHTNHRPEPATAMASNGLMVRNRNTAIVQSMWSASGEADAGRN
jgi:hypothetical protein